VGRIAATADGMAEVIRPAVEVLVGRSLADAGQVEWKKVDQAEDPPARNRTVREDREAAAYTYGYNHSLLAQRAHDVLTVVTALRTGQLGDLGQPRRVILAAFGETTPIAAAARGVAGAAIDRTALDTGGFRFAEVADWRDPRFLPGGAKYLDLPGFLAAHPLPLWLAGEPAPTEAEAAAYRAFGSDAWVVRHAGPADAAPLAAVEWLLGP